MRSELNLSEDHPALAIFETFKSNLTESVLKFVENNNIHFAIIPANCTDRLQPLDLSLNKSVKDFLWREFNTWYLDQILSQLDENQARGDIQPVSLKSTTAGWIV